MPYYHLKDQIQEILDSSEYKEDGRSQELNVNMLYLVIQYSKFQWIKKQYNCIT